MLTLTFGEYLINFVIRDKNKIIKNAKILKFHVSEERNIPHVWNYFSNISWYDIDIPIYNRNYKFYFEVYNYSVELNRWVKQGDGFPSFKFLVKTRSSEDMTKFQCMQPNFKIDPNLLVTNSKSDEDLNLKMFWRENGKFGEKCRSLLSTGDKELIDLHLDNFCLKYPHTTDCKYKESKEENTQPDKILTSPYETSGGKSNKLNIFLYIIGICILLLFIMS